MLQLSNAFPGQEEHINGREYDMIKYAASLLFCHVACALPADSGKFVRSVWKVLVGPNDDWPLAVCDYTSIDAANDARPADRVLFDRVAENQLLFYNPNHRWYYIPQQRTDHLLVLRNTDSSGKRAS